MRIAILQPGYLPWLGFFEQMLSTDCFVYLDDVQYTKQDWRNRNRIKTPDGIAWLTVPVRKAPTATPIHRIEISHDRPWADEHLRRVQAAYGRCPHYALVRDLLGDHLSKRYERLVELDVAIVESVREVLRVDTPVMFASDLEFERGDKTGNLVSICREVGAGVLYDGKAASEFIDGHRFEAAGIDIEFQDYDHPVYPQPWGPFVSHLSVIDLLANVGPDSRDVILRGGSTIAPSMEGAAQA